MTVLCIETGEDAVAPRAEALEADAFGARFVSYTNFDRFEAHVDAFDPGLIVWPGGHLAEVRSDRYGLEYDGLSDPDIDRPGLDEMMAAATARGATLSVTLPTVRYLDRETEMLDELRGFLADLLGGAYGPLPDDLVLEIGSEYFAHFADDTTTGAAEYAAIADVMVEEIALALSDPQVNVIGADVTIAVQAGKTLEDDAAIRDGLSEFALSNVDSIVHHRFSPQPQGIDPRIAEVEQIVDDWEADVVGAGGARPDLFVSAWNVAQYTRTDALDDFLELNPSISAQDVDLEGRTTTSFEHFWQAALSDHSYGAEHPGLILEMFASYAEAGMSAGAVFGTDVVHPGRLSWRDDAQVDHTFVGGDTISLIYEALKGTRALASDGPFDPQADLTHYAFEGDDRVVVFLAAGENAPGEVLIDVEGMGTELTSLWAESLTSSETPGWMETFGIPDNPDVDETPEAGTFAQGHRGAADVAVSDGGLRLTLSANEVVRLSFAKTESGAEALDAISSGAELDLAAMLPDAGLPPCESTYQEDLDEDGDVADADGGGMGIEMLALLLPILMFL